MNEYVEITTQSLDADKNTLQEEVTQLQNDLKQFVEELNQLGSLWEGPASLTFRQQAASDVENIQAICEEMAEYIESMEYAGRCYERCERQVTGFVDKIRI